MKTQYETYTARVNTNFVAIQGNGYASTYGGYRATNYFIITGRIKDRLQREGLKSVIMAEHDAVYQRQVSRIREATMDYYVSNASVFSWGLPYYDNTGLFIFKRPIAMSPPGHVNKRMGKVQPMDIRFKGGDPWDPRVNQYPQLSGGSVLDVSFIIHPVNCFGGVGVRLRPFAVEIVHPEFYEFAVAKKESSLRRRRLIEAFPE